MMVVPPVMMVVPPMMTMVVMPMMPRGHPVAMVDPAPAVPDLMADVADVLDQVGLACCRKPADARQRQGFCAATDKQRSSRK